MEIYIQIIFGSTLVEFIIRILWGLAGIGLTTLGFCMLQKKQPLIRQLQLGLINITIGVVNFKLGNADKDTTQNMESAVANETTESLKNTIRSLDQKPFGDGHTYAKLPEGTRIVSMKDGSYRLAIPVLAKPVTMEFKVGRPVGEIGKPGNETSG